MPAAEIVEGNRLMPGSGQRPAAMAADIAGAPGNQDLHAFPASRIRARMVVKYQAL